MAIVNYSTVANARAESGFTGNSNITDASIQSYLDRATATVQSYVICRYPLDTLDTNFSGSAAEGLLRRIEELLASGNLLIKEYGPEGLDSDKDGYTKRKEAMDMLKDLAAGKLKLIDSNGAEFLTGTPGGSSSGLRSSGMVDDENKFSVSDVF